MTDEQARAIFSKKFHKDAIESMTPTEHNQSDSLGEILSEFIILRGEIIEDVLRGTAEEDGSFTSLNNTLKLLTKSYQDGRLAERTELRAKLEAGKCPHCDHDPRH